MAHKLQSIFLIGPAGRLEALLEEPEAPNRIERAVVICHPHPQYGGTMHNKLAYRMARAARTMGAAVLRFNFRGVGASSGMYDGGEGEQDDLRAAMQYMRERYPGVSLVVGGFSFGARVSLRACCADPIVERIVAVANPVRRGDMDFLKTCGCPKHFVHSTQDEFGPRDVVEQIYAMTSEPKQLTWITSSDHFFSDALDELEDTVRQALG